MNPLLFRHLYLGQAALLELTMRPSLNVPIAARHNTSGSGTSPLIMFFCHEIMFIYNINAMAL